MPFVTTMVMNICLPALLFHTLINASVPINSLSTLALAALFTQVVLALIAVGMLRIAGKDWRLCTVHVVGNTGNLGLPVCLLAFGDEGLAYAITFFAVQCLLLFSVGDVIVSGKFNAARIIKSPILHAVWIGVFFRIQEWSVVPFIDQTLQLLGQIVIPLMLMTLGVSLASMRASQLPVNLFWSAIRTCAALSVGVGIAALFGLTGVARGVLIIQTVTPVAVFNYLLAVKYGKDSSEVSAMILVTHVAAIAYLPVVLAIVL